MLGTYILQDINNKELENFYDNTSNRNTSLVDGNFCPVAMNNYFCIYLSRTKMIPIRVR